ncbi:MAG: DUF1513 domain-containing protein, partial [Pseudomonadota bacterium]
MASRRQFLTALLASASLPGLSWADAGNPAFLSAAMDRSGAFALYGLRAGGEIAFRIALPARGHAAAAHPTAPEAVAFARRPGTYALVMDCVSGAVKKRLDAPEGHHFYGHGAFVAGGDLLCTTESHIASGEGRVGLWSRARRYARIGEISSGGIGPHDILALPGRGKLAVANGGIRTHPRTGREKLNLDTMRPNLAFLTPEAGPTEIIEVPRELHQNSLRHLALHPDGDVACAFQWQGDIFESPPLLALASENKGLTFAEAPAEQLRALNGYAGSVAVSRSDGSIVITSPRGGVAHLYARDGTFLSAMHRADICGVAPHGGSIMATDGLGGLQIILLNGLQHLHAALRRHTNASAGKAINAKLSHMNDRRL